MEHICLILVLMESICVLGRAVVHGEREFINYHAAKAGVLLADA
jgi:hypothetical protein